ncbi:hypothetical protein VP01_4219g1 [Puccinia sorghi]|uniref:Uncharacterized protein n=1 Tax=Puccinia sorghi TaxID=27349 RepID=A0A0L6USL2_9BASI|nr:hypothetical protein VP01_4219g1 [Puccinia sorghi]
MIYKVNLISPGQNYPTWQDSKGVCVIRTGIFDEVLPRVRPLPNQANTLQCDLELSGASYTHSILHGNPCQFVSILQVPATTFKFICNKLSNVNCSNFKIAFSIQAKPFPKSQV